MLLSPSVSDRNTDPPAGPSERYASLISLAVHELRTPASVVGGYLRMLQRDTEDGLGDPQRRMVEEAEKSLGHMVMLVNQLSELAKLDTGAAAVCEESFDLFRMLAEVAADVHEAEDRGVQLRVDGAADGVRLVGDGTRCRVAIAALLRAVLREQPAETVVVADCRRATIGGSATALVVIARQVDLARAADIDAATAPFDELRGGLGLALPIARLVVERLGGRLWSPLAGDTDPASRGAIVLSMTTEEPRH